MAAEGPTNSTSFDVDCIPFNVTDQDDTTVFAISVAFGVIGLVGSFAVILHAISRQLCYTAEVRPVFHMAFASAGYCACLITTVMIYLFVDRPIEDEILKAYLILVTLQEVFYLVIFFLMAILTVTVYLRLRDRVQVLNKGSTLRDQTEARRLTRCAYIISWTVPPLALLPLSLYVIFKDKKIKIALCPICPSITFYPDNKNSTFYDKNLAQNFGFVVAIATYFITGTLIVIFFILCLRLCRKLLPRQELVQKIKLAIKSLRTRLSLYLSTFFFCWAPTITIAVLGLCYFYSCDKGPPNLVVLFYVWAVTAPNQGTLLALVYFWSMYLQTDGLQPGLQRRPFGSRIYRFYGTGEQRSRWPKFRSPSPSTSDNSQSQTTTTEPNSNDVSSTLKVPQPSMSPITTSTTGSKKKPRTPSFLALLDNQDKIDGNDV
ncbi:uncharacterized protein [Diadema antillarum]|uniref:uncharacterized protein n=1 Tax=Diadema antillarum TaxID=105358 RepID=UPI003A89BCB2